MEKEITINEVALEVAKDVWMEQKNGTNVTPSMFKDMISVNMRLMGIEFECPAAEQNAITAVAYRIGREYETVYDKVYNKEPYV